MKIDITNHKIKSVLSIFAFILAFTFFSSCRFLLSQADFISTGSNSSNSEGAVRSVEPRIQNSSSSYKNSGEITSTGLNIPRAANALYTITIGYPEGEYAGRNTASFTLTGSGNTKNVKYFTKPEIKSVPAGSDNWHGMYPYNEDSGTVNGNYWFTDEQNKIKYYKTPAIENGIWRTGSVNQSYWNELKSYLANMESGILKKERDKFGMREYDKDETPYFYIIFDDFGSSSVSLTKDPYTGTVRSIAGTVGVYNNRHIRDYNNADVFYVNQRYIEGYSEYCYGKQYRKKAIDTCISTLLHEYMHYLMDSHHLLEAENEAGVNKGGIINGYYRGDRASICLYFSSTNQASLFHTEGTANYAPYRLLGATDPGAVREWLGVSTSWRPPIVESDTMENTYAVYGAGGLFFSYIAEKYGNNVINGFHKYRESISLVKTLLENKGINYNNADSILNTAKSSLGNINNITRTVLNKEFKDVYVNFLCQMMASLDSKIVIKDGYKTPSSASCAIDWKFNDYARSYAKTAQGSVSGNLPELTFIIHKWESIPEKLTLNANGARSFAFWM